MGSFDVHISSFNSWATTLEGFRRAVVERSLEESDAAGVFWNRVNNFLRFLTKEEKEDDPDVVRLRELFNGYARLEGAKLRKGRLDILDLCLEICAKFRDERRRKQIVSVIADP